MQFIITLIKHALIEQSPLHALYVPITSDILNDYLLRIPMHINLYYTCVYNCNDQQEPVSAGHLLGYNFLGLISRWLH